MKKTLILLLTLFTQLTFSQVAVNTDGSSANTSAMLDVKSSNKGLLIPRMTSAQRDAISSPATGLLVFDTDENNFFFYNGINWVLLKSGIVNWNLDSINLTVADTNYRVGVGTTTPSGRFEVATIKHNGTYGSDLCSGGTASASSYYQTYTPDRAFDDQTTTEWLSDNSLPGYLQYDFGEGNNKRIAKYRIYYEHPSSYDHSPNDWTFEASNDGSTWTTLDTQTGQGWSGNGWKEYTFSNTTQYRYYRIYITDNTGSSDNYVQINETEMMEENLSNNTTLFVNDNKVGIGTSSPSATLDISGTMKLADGNEGSGKILVSDASGNAGWADGTTVNGGGWTVNGNYIYETDDSVGIGTSSISERLTVNGGVQLGNSSGTNTGTIRWNSTTQDFEGYNGTGWVSLSKSNGGWGDNTAKETEGIISSDGAGGDSFGNSVSIDGDYAIVGADTKSVGGNSWQGKAYIFHRSGTTWTQQAGLTASDGAAFDIFGSSVSINGDYAIVGAYWKDVVGNDQGKAYIFHRSGTTWTQQAGLTASDGAAGDYFGISVSIDGDYAIVGADEKYVGVNSHQGKAYIFHRSGTTWTQQAGLTASDGAAYDYFGVSVSIDDDYAIVGADYKSVGGNSYQGKAYIFHRSGTTWTQQAELISSDGAAGDYFGYSVSIDGDYAIVGAYYKSVGGNSHQGKAYIFHRNGTTWTQQAGLTSSDGAAGDYFGVRVSIDGDYAIVGAYKKDVGGNSDQGKAYIFHRSGTIWTQQAGLTASDGAGNDYFGTSVSISGDYTVVGAADKTIGGNSSQGKVYFYKRNN